jgi:hypothetical protein
MKALLCCGWPHPTNPEWVVLKVDKGSWLDLLHKHRAHSNEGGELSSDLVFTIFQVKSQMDVIMEN